MTSQGTAHGRFTRAIQTRNLWAAEAAMREMQTVSLLDALDYAPTGTLADRTLPLCLPPRAVCTTR
jgi:hypothetical protein